MNTIRTTHRFTRLIAVFGVTALALTFAVLVPRSGEAAASQSQDTSPVQATDGVQLAIAGCDTGETRSPAVSLGSPQFDAHVIYPRYDGCVVTGYTEYCIMWIDPATGYPFRFCWYQPIVVCSD